MLFNSFDFIFLFLPVVFVVYNLLKIKKSLYTWLILTGYIFYALFDYRYTILLFLVSIVNYTIGITLSNSNSNVNRKICLASALIFDVGLLLLFKYYNFGLSSIQSLLSVLGISFIPPFLDILLPVGISFYSFAAMSYCIDIYRKKIEPASQFLEFLTYLSLFPNMTSGPIIRYSEISNDLDKIDAINKIQYLHRGVCLFILGLAQKVLVADTIIHFINPLLSDYTNLNIVTAWLVVISYSYQIYFDFSGYSDMAIGLGLMLGFQLPQNFNSPFRALNIADFWKRWHMTLSRWVYDYIFLSLYTSGISKLRIYFNTLISFIILGLWHGTNITFVLFGAYHGLMSILYYVSKNSYNLLHPWIRRSLTFLVVVIGFLIFRSTSLDMLFVVLMKLVDISTLSSFNMGLGKVALTTIVIFSFALTNFFKNTNEINFSKRNYYAILLGLLFLLCLVLIGRSSEFIYYQF